MSAQAEQSVSNYSYLEEVRARAEILSTKKEGRRAIKLVKGLGETAALSSQLLRDSRGSKAAEKEAEIENPTLEEEMRNPIVLCGEATGAQRKVWLLGRAYAGKGRPVVATPPLGVKFNGYIKEHIGNVVPSIERPVLVVGNLGFVENASFTKEQADKVHTSYMATDIHSIVDQVQAGEKTPAEWPAIDLSEYDYTGASQGAMVGLELLAQDWLFSRRMNKGVLVAPAGLLKTDLRSGRGIANLLLAAYQYSVSEPYRTAAYFHGASPAEKQRLASRLAPSITPPTNAIKAAYHTAREILNGEMNGIGAAIDTNLNHQTKQTELKLLVFLEDKTGTPSRWRQEFSAHPKLKLSVDEVRGHHIEGIIRPETELFVIENLYQAT